MQRLAYDGSASVSSDQGVARDASAVRKPRDDALFVLGKITEGVPAVKAVRIIGQDRSEERAMQVSSVNVVDASAVACRIRLRSRSSLEHLASVVMPIFVSARPV
jgi:hypothetical protein